MYWEPDNLYAVLQDWRFGGRLGGEFDAVDFEDDILVVERQIVASVEVYCSFRLSMKDSIDKDMVNMGSTEAISNISVNIFPKFGFSGVTKGEPSLEWIEIERIAEQVDFGDVEPDYDEDEFDRDDDDGA
jgi:hypothetical protein